MLRALSSRIASKVSSNKSDSPFVYTLIQSCIRYKIPYDLMCRLNYTDLLGIVIEFDIDSQRDNLRFLEKERKQKLGYEVVEATDEDILKMHKN